MEVYRFKRKKSEIVTGLVLTIIVFAIFVAALVTAIKNPDGTMDIVTGISVNLLFGSFFLASLFELVSCCTDYVDFDGNGVFQHRFLLSDRSFSIDGVTGMRLAQRNRGPDILKLYCGDKMCFSLERGQFDSNVLWNAIVDRVYPPKLYEGEDDNHFAVGLHRKSKIKFLAALYAGLGLMWAFCVCSADHLSEEDFIAIAIGCVLFFVLLFALLECNQMIYVDGEYLCCRLGFIKRKAHISELRYKEGKMLPYKYATLVYRDGGGRFAKLSSDGGDNVYALKLYLEAHGIQWSALKL